MKVEKIEPKAPGPTYNLIGLSDMEARTLMCILARVGGAPETSFRKHTQVVYEALAEAGVEYYDTGIHKAVRGSMSFDDVEDPDSFKSKKIANSRC